MIKVLDKRKILFHICVIETVYVFLEWILFLAYAHTSVFWILDILFLTYDSVVINYMVNKWMIKMWMGCVLSIILVLVGLLILFVLLHLK